MEEYVLDIFCAIVRFHLYFDIDCHALQILHLQIKSWPVEFSVKLIKSSDAVFQDNESRGPRI